MIVLRGAEVTSATQGVCRIEPYIDRIVENAPQYASAMERYEKLLADEETNCGACKLSEWGKRILALPEIQGMPRAKQLLELYQAEMQQKCSGIPAPKTLAMYGAIGLAALAGILFLTRK